MNRKNLLLFVFWGVAFIVIAWSLPFLAKENQVISSLLSFCLSIIK